VQHVSRPPATKAALQMWESKNKPHRLPNDLKSFLTFSDGLLIRWAIDFNGERLNLGCMHINSLHKLDKFESMAKLSSCGDDSDAETSDDEPDEPEEEDDQDSKKSQGTPYLLDSTCRGGRICLVYKDTDDRPQVWFQALSCKWFFVAKTFTDYYRLMIMHLGLPYWCYAFTDVGLDPVTKQWLRHLLPQRLAIDKRGDNERKNSSENLASIDFESNALQDTNEWKMPRSVVRINLKKLDKYARQMAKGNRQKARRSKEATSPPLGRSSFDNHHRKSTMR